ncbi:MAG: sulfatase [Phycisphaeraceae bacterium]|nr:sulfatase [Phycisphaeraceae bacterium]
MTLSSCRVPRLGRSAKPNLIFVFADQWRAQAVGYAGDPNLTGKTPNIDRLALESLNFSNAVSTCPVCTPYRASLLTGRYALSTGMFLNDLELPSTELTLAEVYGAAGYDTGYIGKWHLDGHGRSSYIPPERRQGFEHWKVLECTHNYNQSHYYEGDNSEKKTWDRYDAMAQTTDAQQYIKDHAAGAKPFALCLSWGTPHAPYQTAPKKYRDMFSAEAIALRPNVQDSESVRESLAGYYAHIVALDDCVDRLLATIDEAGIRDNTIFVLTSDHGDMLGSHNQQKKQRPWDESVRVPFLLRYPNAHGKRGRTIDMPIGTPDILPTLLGLSGLNIPGSVEGEDFASLVRGGKDPGDREVMIQCPSPFGQWLRRQGGKEYRGIRTRRYTYVRDLEGPWLLYDNEKDPYQMTNMVGLETHRDLQKRLDHRLNVLLVEQKDAFLPGPEYIKQWGHTVNAGGTVPYTN